MILLADDEPAFQRLTAGWLRAQGHEVITVGDGDGARDAFSRHRPDVVLLDLAMPPHLDPQGGIALIPAFAPAPVVVMTGHADQALAMQAIEAGAWDFLAKPVDPDLLKVVVARAVERARLAQEIATLRARGEAGEDMGLIGQSPPMVALRALIRRVAPTNLPVMVLGPSGTGKELVARAIHNASPRAKEPLVPVHCGAVPADLLESELFGHLKGSFTGAHADRAGLVEAAHGGTLFLDEIGEMPPAMQVKLLRFLADGTYQPVGARDIRKSDVRIVAATHRDLAAAVADGSFREDLYYRLKGVVLTTPRLDERGADKALLAQIFLRRAAPEARFASAALEWIVQRAWPGNVRELRAAVECAAALAQGTAIGVDDLAFATGETIPVTSPPANLTLEEEVAALERRRIVEALERTGHNHTHTARNLGLSRVGLLKKMDRMGLR
ncbi:MAG: sigma-54-dependent Fis family transcriptional regulator [Novosphingobium sp. 63-713]|uniref:sigma-54-dependent transcriptional regulator n=1 Tax=unclassified Novosphingobium TaxID=2644732 RepID=UPI0009608F95|nr:MULTISPECIES: sigma-54 dependent transcriptional regulator [unclassified Novosphingobium]MBN9144467.1 sigma-54-dependent Fis family transcriptional regulator [Novosphingobium sp.]MDR6707795.1 two-component system NtrC family response regulator [Novosphingobium sp. 1748]OJX93574.1 MAG: sigma-54-dependent Fis family transcriptional regulator [Novosphingobium sp. 63-713]